MMNRVNNDKGSGGGGKRQQGGVDDGREDALERAGITCNKNSIPFDPLKPTITSGIRLGTPAATTRGFGTTEFELVGDLIARVLDGLAEKGKEGNAETEAAVRQDVLDLCQRFPIYG